MPLPMLRPYAKSLLVTLLLVALSTPAYAASLVPDPAHTAEPGSPPSIGWAQSDAGGNPVNAQWLVGDVAGKRSVVATTRLSGDAYLHHSFTATGAFAVDLVVRSGPSLSQRGVGFGLSHGEPGPTGNRALYLAFLGNGQIGVNDGTQWRLLTPYRPNTWHQLRLVVDPSAEGPEPRGLGGAWLYIDGKLTSETAIPLASSAGRPDTVYVNNGGGSGQQLVVADIRVTPLDTLSAPQSLFAQVERPAGSLPARVALTWTPVEGARRTNGYRVFRCGDPIGYASSTSFIDAEVKPGMAYSYTVRAVAEGGSEGLPSWPAAAVVPVAAISEGATGGAFDLVVYGGTPGGVAAALAAARRGSRVALISANHELGGMMSGGLGVTDERRRQAASGLFKEFVGRVLAAYQQAYGADSRQVRECSSGYWFEPGIAEAIFSNMVASTPGITVYWNQTIDAVETAPLWRVPEAQKRVTALVTRPTSGGPERLRFTARTFVDATYEGDLASAAGASFRVGREARSEFGEQYAGVVYWSWDTMELLPGSTGDGDKRIQAYNYRFTLTNRVGNRAQIPKPPHYERFLRIYRSIANDVQDGKIAHISQVISFGALPNDKYDINNMGRYWPSTDYIEHNYDYPTATPQRRSEIAAEHREYILGMLWYLQHDPDLPEGFRREALQWGFPLDQYQDNNHFPQQLYVREGIRIEGRYLFTEHDAESTQTTPRAPVHQDSVAVAEYPMDSHATRNREPDHPDALEGFFYLPRTTMPSQVPLGVLQPKGLDALMVCCAVSATHVGYGTLRLEPLYMAMGEACGVVADLARRRWIPTSRMPVLPVQQDLTTHGALLTYFDDIAETAGVFQAMQTLGTRGLFEDYAAKPNATLDRGTAAQWLVRAVGVPATPEALLALSPGASASAPLTRSELTAWLRYVKQTYLRLVSTGSWVPSLPEPASDVVTRGEFCSAVWRFLP